jgi:phospholipid/cholesterol/gamma-HCH transport system ATP-binding protein
VAIENLKLETAAQERDEPSGETNSNGVLTVKNVTKRFGPQLVLDNVSVEIEKGKTTVVIGPSGCGKTVLIKHLIVLLRPTLGEVYFKGQRIDNLSEHELNEVRTHYGSSG